MDLFKEFSGHKYANDYAWPLMGKVIRTWSRPENDPVGDPIDMYWKVIGVSILPGDILLALVDASDSDIDYEASANTLGITFQTLANLCGEFGFQVLPNDQDPTPEDEEKSIDN